MVTKPVFAFFLIFVLAFIHKANAQTPQNEEAKQKAKEYVLECRDKYKTDLEMVRNRQEVPGKEKCFYTCLGGKLNFVDAKGNIRKEYIRKRIRNKVKSFLLYSTLSNCLNIKKQNNCETAEAIVLCMSGAGITLPGVPVPNGNVLSGKNIPGLPFVPKIKMLPSPINN